MAPTGQFCLQVPHLMHLVVSITCLWRGVPVMASTGQLRAQRVQPMHLSVITYWLSA